MVSYKKIFCPNTLEFEIQFLWQSRQILEQSHCYLLTSSYSSSSGQPQFIPTCCLSNYHVPWWTAAAAVAVHLISEGVKWNANTWLGASTVLNMQEPDSELLGAVHRVSSVATHTRYQSCQHCHFAAYGLIPAMALDTLKAKPQRQLIHKNVFYCK